MNCPQSTQNHDTSVETSPQCHKHMEAERIRNESTQLSQNQFKTNFIVPDMRCAGCIGKIERELSKLPGVKEVRANLTLKTVSTVWDATKSNGTAISRKLDDLGFDHHLSEKQNRVQDRSTESDGLLMALAVAGFAAANIMLLSVSVWSGADAETAQLFHLISGLIAIPTVAFAGQPFFRSALRALSAGRLNMDVPISLAVILALFLSIYESLTGGEEAYFDASVTLLFFLLIGRYLDQLMRQKARGAVDRLSNLSAKDGVRVDDNGNTTYVKLKDIRPGETLRVFPGERFPVDGRILSGTTEIDRSLVTGESENVFAQADDQIEAGSLNVTSPIDVEATSSAEASYLAHLRNMMEVAEKGRGNYTRIADRMASIYAPAVHLLALVTFIGWMVTTAGDWHTSFYTAIAVLIVTCPCALGLAVPVAHVIGANRLMKQGVLIRDGSALERLVDVDCVILDKTGTLTDGDQATINVSNLRDELIPVLKALAARSSHPIARRISKVYDCVPSTELEQITEKPGFGVEAIYLGKTVRFGRPEWVHQIGNTGTSNPKNSSAAFAVTDGEIATFVVNESLREGAVLALEALRKRALQVELLSGDRMKNVSRLADSIGIDQYYADCMPQDKLNHINTLTKVGRKPLMVGDGINDAPALAAAHASISPATASDVGRQAADFIFVRKSLLAIPFALDTAKRVHGIVKQNFALAIAYNCIAVPLAMMGFVTPLIAAIAMSASSIAVVANSFRIDILDPKTTSWAQDVQQHHSILSREATA